MEASCIKAAVTKKREILLLAIVKATTVTPLRQDFAFVFLGKKLMN